MSGADYIKQLIAEGEHEHQDFKYQITDAKKIARSISAFANHSGGHLLVGVKDNGRVAGVSGDEEIYMIEQAARMYCQPQQTVECKLWRVEGHDVLKVDIAEAAQKPVKAPDEHGRWRAYYRVNDENIEAGALHVKVMSQTAGPQAAAFTFCDHERTLLSYLQSHGGISLRGYMRLAHISHQVAEYSAMTLCSMGVLSISYHNGASLLSLSDKQQ